MCLVGLIDATEMALEGIDVRGPEATELREPCVHFHQRLGPKAVKAALRVDGGLNETGVAEYAQVLGDGGLGHAQLALDFADGLLGRDEKAEDCAAVWFSDDFEGFHVFWYTAIRIYVSRHIKRFFSALTFFRG